MILYILGFFYIGFLGKSEERNMGVEGSGEGIWGIEIILDFL